MIDKSNKKSIPQYLIDRPDEEKDFLYAVGQSRCFSTENEEDLWVAKTKERDKTMEGTRAISTGRRSTL